MTAFNYARLKATADRLIARYGRTATLIAPAMQGGPVYDSLPIDREPEYPCKLVNADYTQRDIDGQRVLATDKRLYVAVDRLTIAPKTDWLVRDGRVEYTIVSIAPLQPGDMVLLWEMQCRL